MQSSEIMIYKKEEKTGFGMVLDFRIS